MLSPGTAVHREAPQGAVRLGGTRAWRRGATRSRVFAAALALVGLLPGISHAALDRYRLRAFDLRDFSSTVPKVTVEPRDGRGRGAAVIERAEPRLLKLLIVADVATTTFVSTFNGFIWFSNRNLQGPRGTFGAATSTLDPLTNVGTVTWPVLTGWTVTGATFCNADPSFICSLAVASQLVSVDPALRSGFYDLGPWEFHGTGFQQSPFVFLTATIPGNVQIFLRGVLEPNAAVPALPLLGLAALGASLLAMGVAGLRRQRDERSPPGPEAMDRRPPAG